MEQNATKTRTLLVASRDEAIVSAVGDLGLRVETATHRSEIAERCGSANLLILDDEVGRHLIRTIRERRPDLKIVFVSHARDAAIEVEARRQGIHFFLHKPVSAAILAKVVAKAIEHESTRNRWGVA